MSTTPGDETGQRLVAIYRALVGEHPNWAEYLDAMVDDRRLVARIVIDHTYTGGAHT